VEQHQRSLNQRTSQVPPRRIWRLAHFRARLSVERQGVVLTGNRRERSGCRGHRERALACAVAMRKLSQRNRISSRPNGGVLPSEPTCRLGISPPSAGARVAQVEMTAAPVASLSGNTKAIVRSGTDIGSPAAEATGSRLSLTSPGLHGRTPVRQNLCSHFDEPKVRPGRRT
jgi:hypothetical protein